VTVQAALHRDDARDGLHIVVHQCQKRTEVASVDGVKGSVSQIHVLLRHRLLSIAQAQESA
jgi:hypothetical protein